MIHINDRDVQVLNESIPVSQFLHNVFKWNECFVTKRTRDCPSLETKNKKTTPLPQKRKKERNTNKNLQPSNEKNQYYALFRHTVDRFFVIHLFKNIFFSFILLLCFLVWVGLLVCLSILNTLDDDADDFLVLR